MRMQCTSQQELSRGDFGHRMRSYLILKHGTSKASWNISFFDLLHSSLKTSGLCSLPDSLTTNDIEHWLKLNFVFHFCTFETHALVNDLGLQFLGRPHVGTPHEINVDILKASCVVADTLVFDWFTILI